MKHSKVSIDDLAERIRDIEETFKALPGFYGNYAVQREMMRMCLGEVHRALTGAGYEDTEFPGELALGLALLNEGHRIGLFALPRELRDSSPRHPVIRNSVEATAAAILEMSSSDKGRTQLEWAEQIAHALAEAGYQRPGRGGAYTGSAIKKWRKDCIQRRHPSISFYDDFIEYCRAEGCTDIKLQLRAITDVWAKRLGRKNKLSSDEALTLMKRTLNLVFGASLGDDDTITDVDRVLKKLRDDGTRPRGRRKPIVRRKGNLGG